MAALSMPPPNIILPFVRMNDGVPDFWVVIPTGNWSIDNLRGRDFAMRTIAVMKYRNAQCLLGSITREIIAKGNFGGIEVGFTQAIAERASR